ncbi:MAG: amino acid ABC transporter substrate-binding protein, partial [Anaerolineae bacterium]|nr:amino acid ABC transporter substrate-binding protein [Anaerolineae bacterium]
MVRKLIPLLAALLVLCLGLGAGVNTHAQDAAPTLAPPTLVPTSMLTNLDALPSESDITRIVRDNLLRVGVLYNEPPFGLFNIRGVESGFDADLARSIAETWGVNIEYHQATRQNGIDMVASGEIDLLIAAQPHMRDLDSRVEFSQSYYPSVQALVVRQGDGATVLGHMADRKIGVVLGTRAEGAVDYWQSRVDYHFEIFRYLTLDLAMAALDSHEIDGVVGNRVRLSRVIKPDLQRFVDDPVMPEPYAIAMSRQDVNLRNLVNRTLQYLYTTGKLEEISKSNFDGASFPATSFVVWDNVGGDAPKPDQFGTDVPVPPQYVVPRLQSDRQLRVAGLVDLPADAPESQRRLDAVNRALINAIAQRWQVSIVPVTGG